jgi:hypothetical protein
MTTASVVLGLAVAAWAVALFCLYQLGPQGIGTRVDLARVSDARGARRRHAPSPRFAVAHPSG